MIAETISLGILSLPSVLAAIGFVPGIILLVGLGALATYTGYVFGQFKMRYLYSYTTWATQVKLLEAQSDARYLLQRRLSSSCSAWEVIS